MLDYLIEIGILLLLAPILWIVVTSNSHSDYEDMCVNVMPLQALFALIVILLGIGKLLG